MINSEQVGKEAITPTKAVVISDLKTRILDYIFSLELEKDKFDDVLKETLENQDNPDIELEMVFDMKFDSTNYPGEIKFYYHKTKIYDNELDLYPETYLRISAGDYTGYTTEIYNLFEDAILDCNDDFKDKFYEDFKDYKFKGLKISKITSMRTTSGKLSRYIPIKIKFNNPNVDGWHRIFKRFS